jgi:putative hydrolase of the HAD superfamily
MYQHIFFDLDHTIWDFDTNSYEAFEKMFFALGIESELKVGFDDFHAHYLKHNQYYWDLYAKGGIRQEELKWKRMSETLFDFDLKDENKAKKMSEVYLGFLPECTNLFPYTREILEYLTIKNYVLHIISNGFENTQHSKLKHSGIDKYFKNIVTSERCGFIKPDAKIFQLGILEAKTTKEHCLMIGDSPEADLQGAFNAGIISVYMDHHKKDTSVPHNHRIHTLKELENIL